MLPRDYIFLGIRIGGVLLVISTIALAPSVFLMGSIPGGSGSAMVTTIVAVGIAFLISALLIWGTNWIVDRVFNRITDNGEYYGDGEYVYDEADESDGGQDDDVVDESSEIVTGSDATKDVESTSRLRMERVQGAVFSILGMWLLVDSLPRFIEAVVNIVSIFISSYYESGFVFIGEFRRGSFILGLAAQILPVILGFVLFLNGNGLVGIWQRIRTPRIMP